MTSGTYGISHDNIFLNIHEDHDMYPSYWGRALAAEALRLRRQATEVGETSIQVRPCSFEYQEWRTSLEQLAEWENAGLLDEVRQNYRFHYCFHRPGVETDVLNPYNLFHPPNTSPSFSALSRMEEACPALPNSEDEYHYTWVTSPDNLFVASSDRSVPYGWRQDKGMAVWDLDNQDDVVALDHLLTLQPLEFQEGVHERMGI